MPSDGNCIYQAFCDYRRKENHMKTNITVNIAVSTFYNNITVVLLLIALIVGSKCNPIKEFNFSNTKKRLQHGIICLKCQFVGNLIVIYPYTNNNDVFHVLDDDDSDDDEDDGGGGGGGGGGCGCGGNGGCGGDGGW